jgi:hypothetical protein
MNEVHLSSSLFNETSSSYTAIIAPLLVSLSYLFSKRGQGQLFTFPSTQKFLIDGTTYVRRGSSKMSREALTYTKRSLASGRQSTITGPITCTIFENTVQIADKKANDGTNTICDWRCENDDGVFHIDLPADVLAAHKENELNGGKTTIKITGGTEVKSDDARPDGIFLDEGSTVEIVGVESSERRLKLRALKKVGKARLLVVRVIAPDVSPTLTVAQLSDKYFGTSGDKVNLASVYNQCSHGQFTFVPANGTGIIKGVSELVITTKAMGTSPWALENMVSDAIAAKVGRTKYDFVAFVFPPGTAYPGVGTGWAAYAFINEYRSFFNDMWSSYVTAQVHEIGHNFGLTHSNEGGVSYGDASSMMGYSYPYDDFPTMCFNGAKHWFLGWYEGKQVEIVKGGKGDGSNGTQVFDISKGSWTGKIASFVDLNVTTTEVIVLKIGNFYIQYNKVEGINSGTQEKRDELTVTQASALNAESDSIVGLSAKVPKVDLALSTSKVTVEFCGAVKGTATTPDYVKVGVYLAGTTSSCADAYDSRTSTLPGAVGREYTMSGRSSSSDVEEQPLAFSKSDCDGDEFFVQLFLNTDLNPQETEWVLQSFDGSFVRTSPAYSKPEHKYVSSQCIPRDHYQFIIYDSGNDGLCCGSGHGSYSLFVDGEALTSGSEFGKAEDTYIQPKCDAESGTLLIDLTTDYFGGESSWTLRSIGSNQLGVAGGPYESQERYIIVECIPLDECYEFTLEDSNGDGLQGYGSGEYTVTFNDEVVVYSSFPTGYEEVTTFGLTCADRGTVVGTSGTPHASADKKMSEYEASQSV